MKHLTQLSERMFVDLKEVSFIDLEKKLEVIGPAFIRAQVVIAGHKVIMNESEVTALIDAMKVAGTMS